MTAEAETGTVNGLRSVLDAAGTNGGEKRVGWYMRLVTAYLRYRERGRSVKPDERTEADRALSVVRSACVKTALSGAASGAAITGATLITAEAPTGAFIAVPLAAAGVGGDLVARAIIH